MRANVMHRGLGVIACAVAGVALWAQPGTSRAAVIMTAEADAEVRESAPETPRNTGTAASGQITELAIRSGGANNQVAILRFDLAAAGVTNPGDIGGFADLYLYQRADS